MGLPVLGAAAIGGAAGLLGGGGPSEQTTTSTRTVDPSTQQALDAFRQNALSQFQQFQGGQMNPAMQSFLQNAGLLSGGLLTRPSDRRKQRHRHGERVGRHLQEQHRVHEP